VKKTMSEQALSGAGYHVIWGNYYIGEVVDPKIPKQTRNMNDSSTHDALAANGGVETKSIGTITQADGSVKIYLIGGTVQTSLRTDFKAGTEREVYFIRPSSGALAFTGFKCDAVISSFEETPDKKGFIVQDFGITPTTELEDVSIPAAGLTTPFFAIADDDTPTPNVITPSPAAAAAVYAYKVSLYADNTTFTITPTATAGTIYVNNVLVVSGAASEAITAPTSGKKLYVPIVVFETNKMPKPYLLQVKKGPVTKP
jgi:hypothetical protein